MVSVIKARQIALNVGAVADIQTVAVDVGRLFVEPGNLDFGNKLLYRRHIIDGDRAVAVRVAEKLAFAALGIGDHKLFLTVAA